MIFLNNLFIYFFINFMVNYQQLLFLIFLYFLLYFDFIIFNYLLIMIHLNSYIIIKNMKFIYFIYETKTKIKI